MSLTSALCFTGILLIGWSIFRKGADPFSPSRVFAIVWLVAFGVTELKLSSFQFEWDGYAWALMVTSVLSFLAGCFAVAVINSGRQLLPTAKMRDRLLFNNLRADRLFTFVIVLFAVYVVCYVTEWLHAGELPAFAQQPDQARNSFPIFGIHLFVNSMPIILFLVGQYFVLVRRNTWRKIVLSFIFLVTFLSSFLLLNRLFYVFFLIMLVVFTYYSSRLITIRNLLLAVPVFVLVLSYLQSIREARYAEKFMYIISRMNVSEEYSFLAGPYIYIVMNLENFANSVSKVENFTYGYFTADFFLALVGLKHWMKEYFGLDRNLGLITESFNTLPFFWDYYLDFGPLGVLIPPALLGGAISMLYYRMRAGTNPRLVGLYACAVFVMALSFFTNPLTLLNVVSNIGLLIVSQYWIYPSREDGAM
jgi:oligosaccharide repeat unit polymerase